MRKTEKTKKSKVPKLTEEEYVAYISSLKEGQEPTPPPIYELTKQKRDEESLE